MYYICKYGPTRKIYSTFVKNYGGRSMLLLKYIALKKEKPAGKGFARLKKCE
jgi:hypothetical protein